MTKTLLAGLASIACACVADTSSQPATAPFLGTWSCQDTTSITESGSTQTGTPQPHTITIAAAAMNNLAITDMGTSGTCTIQASTSGNNASVTGGTCTQTDGQGTTLNLTYNGGSFNVNASTMSGNATAAYSGTRTGTAVTGTLSVTFQCTKK